MKDVRAVLAGLVSGVAIYAVMLMVFGLGLVDSMYISLTVAMMVASAVALSEREANIGAVSAFIGIAIMASIAKFVLGFDVGAILVRLPTLDVVIPTNLLPFLAIGFVGLMAVARLFDWDIGRLTLFIVGSIAWLSYFAVTTDAGIRLLALTIVTICSAIPLLRERETEKGRLLSVAPIPIVASIDLSFIEYPMLLVPLLLFVAVDPTKRIGTTVRELASVAILALLLLQIVGIALG